jgi:hypothetical protein
MRMIEAQATFAYVRSRYADRILVAIDDSHATADDHGYNIVLLLLAGQRRLATPFVASVKSILLCWEYTFLQPEPPRQPIAIIEEQIVIDKHTPENDYQCGNRACICHKNH